MRYTKASIFFALLTLSGCARIDQWQRGMILRPVSTMAKTPADNSLEFSSVQIPAPGVEKVAPGVLNSWWLQAESNAAPAVLYLHGNGDTISTRLDAIRRLHDAGFAVLAIDYRGFGASSQVLPDEQSLYADAQAGWRKLHELAPAANKHLVYGHSLGGAVAIELAVRTKGIDALAVEGTFTSIAEIAKNTSYGWLPLSLILTQKFDSREKIAQVTVPKLFIHCATDKVVPIEMERNLFAAASGPKQLLVLNQGSHNNCGENAPGWTQALRRIGGLEPS